MKPDRTRLALLGVFALCLAVQLIAFIAVADRMWPEDLQSLVLKLLGIYSVHFGVILGGIFAQPKRVGRSPSAPIAWAAIILAVLWNVLLVWRSASFSMAKVDSATEVVKYLDSTASASSFLVAGALAFYFAKSAETKQG